MYRLVGRYCTIAMHIHVILYATRFGRILPFGFLKFDVAYDCALHIGDGGLFALMHRAIKQKKLQCTHVLCMSWFLQPQQCLLSSKPIRFSSMIASSCIAKYNALQIWWSCFAQAWQIAALLHCKVSMKDSTTLQSSRTTIDHETAPVSSCIPKWDYKHNVMHTSAHTHNSSWHQTPSSRP